MDYHELFRAIETETYRGKSREELLVMLKVAGKFQASNPHSSTGTFAITVIRDELARIEQNEKHAEQIEENRRLHQTAIDESQKLRKQVKKLEKPHWTLTPSFWVIVLTMIFAAIAAWPVIHEWLQVSQPSKTSSNSQTSQSNSTPTKSAVQQTSPPAIYTKPDKNQILK